MNILNIFRPKQLFKNSGFLPNLRSAAAKRFLRYGNKSMLPNWSQVLMSDEDNYTGIMYGVVNLRAVTTAQLANTNLKTDNKKNDETPHPYLDIIDKSPSFSNFQFWYNCSTYLDLEGVMYVMAIRALAGETYTGKIQQFKLLNPFNVQRNFDPKTGELVGYTEYKAGMSRVIPKEMIIPIINLNPFSETPYSMADATKEHQFTLKTANDYTRTAIANNINAPGIIVTDKELTDPELANFKARLTEKHERGEPIFGGGTGSVDWKDMQQDLNKSALKDVTSISLQNIIAASGVSKTMMGWEESGTTRDTAAVQKDNFIELRAIPQLQLIIDALNQDFKNYYPDEYKATEAVLVIENPLETNLDEEGKVTTNLQSAFDLYQSLIDMGYKQEEAAQYANGEIGLANLSPPKPPKKEETPPPAPAKEETQELHQDDDLDLHLQQVEMGLLSTTEASLRNTIINIDNRLLMTVASNIETNAYESEEDLLGKRERKTLQNELELALGAFYGVIIPLYAYSVLSKRLKEHGILVAFKVNTDVKSFIKDVAFKASLSHTDTLLDSMMKTAQKAALAGKAKTEISREIISKYGGEITNTRAVTVARTETNRAFTMAQYQADKQFLKAGKFEGRAYKQWVTRSSNPCAFCQEMASQPPIPFDTPFAELGDELTAVEDIEGKSKVSKMTVGFLEPQAGNLHPNCQCAYELIIEGE